MTTPDDELRDQARQDVEDLPAETALGNVDADSEGPDSATFPDSEQ